MYKTLEESRIRMYERKSCDDTFLSPLNNHMDECDHWPESKTCDRTFRTWSACNQHVDDTRHGVPLFNCEIYNQELDSQNAANQADVGLEP